MRCSSPSTCLPRCGRFPTSHESHRLRNTASASIKADIAASVQAQYKRMWPSCQAFFILSRSLLRSDKASCRSVCYTDSCLSVWPAAADQSTNMVPQNSYVRRARTVGQLATEGIHNDQFVTSDFDTSVKRCDEYMQKRFQRPAEGQNQQQHRTSAHIINMEIQIQKPKEGSK